MDNFKRLTLTSYINFFLVGFFINIGGAVSTALGADLGTGTVIIGYCFSAFMIGRIFGISGNGFLMKKRTFNNNVYLRLIPFVSLLAVLGFQVTTSVWMLVLFLFISGIGIGALYSMSNMILVDIYTGKQRAFHISMINFLYSAGSICSPFLSGLLLQNGIAWNRPYLIFAALLVGAMIFLLPSNYGTLYRAGREESRDTGKMNSSWWMICAGIVMYILAEFSITYWTPVYMREALGKDAFFAGSCVSAFWVAVLIGRLSAGFLLRYIHPRKYILISGAMAVFSLLILQFLTANVPILAAVFCTGFFCAGLFPSLFTYGTDMAETLKGTFPTYMMISSAIGSLLAMPTGSILKNVIGVKYILFTPIIAITFVLLLILFSHRPPQRLEPP